MTTRLTLGLLLATLASASLCPSGRAQEERAQEEHWDALEIAERESRRMLGRLGEEVDQTLVQMNAQSADPGALEKGYAHLVDLGPDVVVVLDEALGTQVAAGRIRTASYAAGAMVRVFTEAGPSRNEAILDRLQAHLASGDEGREQATLLGLRRLDHPRAVQMARPFLQSENSELVAAAISVLAVQSSDAAVGLLRPLLTSKPEHAARVIEALQQAGSEAAADDVSALLAETTDPEVMVAGIDYLQQYGGFAAISPLRRILDSSQEEWATAVPNPVRSACIVALREIGLRGNQRVQSDAERALVDAWKKHPAKSIQNWARWELGHFRNADAFDFYESEFENWSGRDRNRYAKPWMDLAQAQAQFRRWDDALQSLKRVEVLDSKQEYEFDTAVLRCRAYCGKELYSRAATALKELSADYSRLPNSYPEVAKMAAMEKYAPLFEPR